MSKLITIDTNDSTAIKVEAGKVLPLLSEDDPKLKTPTKEFSFLGEGLQKAESLARDLIETVKAHRAFGLAANQCGIDSSVIAFGYGDDYSVMFNPKIISSSQETVMVQEGCLSFPFLILNINRPKTLTLEFQDYKGDKQTQTLEGMSARVILHELDHLNGITFNTLAKPLALKNGLKKREKNMKRYAKHIVSQRMISNG